MTILVRQNIYGAYLDGEVSATEALRSLCADYEELDASYRDFERMREQLREQISGLVERVGGKAEVAGFGSLAITAPSITKSYDRAALGVVIAMLRDQGLGDIADQIARCEIPRMRAGGLRIEREKSPARG